MKLYHNLLSPNVRRVRLTAAVLGIKLDEHIVDFAKGEHKSPAFLAINPNGAVPALVDGDYVMTESHAIMQYLASLKPESGLLPRDEKARIDVTRWQFWDASHWSPALSTIAFERILKRRVFGDEVTRCPRCGDALRVLAFITDPKVTAHILEHLGQTSDAAPIAPARAPPDAPVSELEFGV